MQSSIRLYDQRNAEKKKLSTTKQREFFIDPGEIWYIKLGQNIGSEQNGKTRFLRPVLVIKKCGNLYYALPLTSQEKDNEKFYCEIHSTSYHDIRQQGKRSRLIWSQLRSFDKKRFLDCIGRIHHSELFTIKEKLRKFFS